ncbi:MAG: hypothetical protein ABI333_12730 [bacterium]
MADDGDKSRPEGSAGPKGKPQEGAPSKSEPKRVDPFDEDLAPRAPKGAGAPVDRKAGALPDGKAPSPEGAPKPDAPRPSPARRGAEERPETEAAPLEADARKDDDADAVAETPRRRFSFRRRPKGAQEDAVADRRVAPLDDYPPPDDGDLDELDLPAPPRSPLRRPPWWAVLGGVLLVGVVVLVLLGEYNTERYYLVCDGKKAAAHRGRGFPWPFGHQPMVGSQYRAVPLDADAQCQTQELDNEGELQSALLSLVITEAQRLSLLHRASDLGAARLLVNQGFLLAPNAKKQRALLVTIRAALDFQQGRVAMRELESALQSARRLFVSAKGHKTRHGKEAEAWIGLVDHLLDRLRRRLAGDPQAHAPVRVAPGPPRSSLFVPASPGVDGGVPVVVPLPMRPTPRPAPAPVLVKPDAGVAGGGILL